MNKILEIKDLSSISKKRYVYRNINFEASGGEIIGLLGHNGAGKSTMLRKIANIEASQAGEIIINGKVNNINKYRKDVIYIPDVIELNQSFKIKEQIKLYEKCYELDQTFINKYLRRMKLEMNDEIAALSKGNQEMLQLIILIAIEASVIVLDEPFSAIDIFRREIILEMIVERITDERVIIITSHLIDEIEPIINRLIYLHEANIVIDREVEAILSENESLISFLKTTFTEGGELC